MTITRSKTTCETPIRYSIDEIIGYNDPQNCVTFTRSKGGNTQTQTYTMEICAFSDLISFYLFIFVLLNLEFDRIERPSRESITQKINTFIAIHPPSVHCSPPPKYIWRKNDAILSESENIKITSNGTVFISNLDELAMGYYELEMVNTFLESKGVFQSKQIARRLDLKIYGKFSSFFLV